MSSTNHTTNYNLPQFVGTDKPAWLGDVNPAMSAIDTQMKANADAAAQAAGDAATADGKAVQAQNGVNTITSALNINDYNTVNGSSIVSTAGLTVSGSFTVAQNTAGSLYKFYGQVNIVNGSDNDITIALSPISGLSGYYGLLVDTLNDAPDTAYNVSNCGFQFVRLGNGELENLWGVGFAVGTNGGVYFLSTTDATITIPAHRNVQYKFIPCLYFNTDFGDVN